MEFSLDELFKLIYLSIACGAISFTVSKSKFFESLRTWTKAKVPVIGEALSCPYCLSHWVALGLTAVFLPDPLRSFWVTGTLTILIQHIGAFVVGVMAMVALASLTCRMIYSCYIVMMPPPDKTAK